MAPAKSAEVKTGVAWFFAKYSIERKMLEAEYTPFYVLLTPKKARQITEMYVLVSSFDRQEKRGFPTTIQLAPAPTGRV